MTYGKMLIGHFSKTVQRTSLQLSQDELVERYVATIEALYKCLKSGSVVYDEINCIYENMVK